MDHRTRILISATGVAGLSALTQLLFVVTKLPVIFWADLVGGILATVVTVFLMVPLRRRFRRPA